MLGIWACVALLAGADDNWPEFRAFHGVSKATNTPVTFGESENVKWKTPIPGKAWASPVIWGDRIWLANAPVDGKELHVLGVDRESGKIVQDFKVFDIPFPEFCHATNSHASCTPTVEEGRLYAHFGSNGTAAIDTKTGAKLWERRDLPCNHFRGPASSPILVGDRLYVQFDGFDFQYVVCLDKNTGKTIWKKDRDTEYGEIDGDRKKAYGTPSLIEHAGRKMLVTSAAFETIAFNPDNGDFLWRVKHGGMNGAARPIYAHGLIYLCAGQDDRTLVAVKPDGTGDISSQIAWSTGKNVPLRGSPLLVGDLLFMGNDSGVVSCLDAKTGAVHFRERLGKAFWASPIYADGKVYFFDQEGLCPVIKAEPKLTILAKNKLSDGCNASPAALGSSLYVRTKTTLYRFEK